MFVILTAVAIISTAFSFFTVQRVKNQIAEMLEVLDDIKKGNGNRRILSTENELAAPIAYEINEIILYYEDKIAGYKKTEETNKQLMTSLSHDVRTPLTTLIGYLDAIHKGIATEKEFNNYVETARRKANELKEYIDVLFDWFKLGSNEFVINITAVELTELTRNILIDWIPIFEDKDINYVIEIPEQPFIVNIDIDGYMRILNNLIQNTVSHSKANKIIIKMSKQGNNLKLSLSDNGIGIEKEDLKHIFERLHKCSSKGSGIGLSIVYQLTEKMGGNIYVESMPESGTVFNLFFPLVF